MAVLSSASLVELEIAIRLLDIGLVALVKVLGQDDVAILAHCVHASLLADGRNLCIADLVWPRHIVLQIHLLAQVHAGCARLPVTHILTSAAWHHAEDCMPAGNAG